MATNTNALRKRAQIAKANRTMFAWIAASSVIVGASIVVSIFLVQTLVYNQKVLNAKNETIGILRDNNEAVPQLKSAVRVLDTNEALASIKANPDDQPIQVILDALPSEANSLALGASLQTKLLSDVPNLQVTSLQVTPVAGVEATSEVATDEVASDATAEESVEASEVTFQFAVTGPQDSLRQVLVNMQRSLRIVDVRNLTITASDGGQLSLEVNARAFYVPAKTIMMTQKVVPR